MTETKENKKRSIYQKLSEARVELQDRNIKKSGENKYSHFTYYELSDLLPAINEICALHGMLTTFNISSPKNEMGIEEALLTVHDTESADQITFVSPTAEAYIGKKSDGSGGADPIQNLGGKITYMRRYMLMTAFEIVESDVVDSKEQVETKKAEEKPDNTSSAPAIRVASESQKKMYYAIAKSAGYDGEMAKNIAKKAFNLNSFADISFSQCSTRINKMNERAMEANRKKEESQDDKIDRELSSEELDAILEE